jgi:hypothetical protein
VCVCVCVCVNRDTPRYCANCFSDPHAAPFRQQWEFWEKDRPVVVLLDISDLEDVATKQRIPPLSQRIRIHPRKVTRRSRVSILPPRMLYGVANGSPPTECMLCVVLLLVVLLFLGGVVVVVGSWCCWWSQGGLCMPSRAQGRQSLNLINWSSHGQL